MIDFHSHILPGMDDGSSSTEESMEMLRLSYSQGITEIVATSHFYATQESPEHFLRRRACAARHLEEKIAESRGQTGERSNKSGANKDKTGGQIAEKPSDMSAGHAPARSPEKLVGSASAIQSDDTLLPRIHLGAEVCYYTGIVRTANLRQLCIGETGILLLEMPFHKWSGRMVDEVIELARDNDLTILLAHIDRYLTSQSTDTWEMLAEEGVLFQVNASAFLDGWLTRRRAFRLLHEEKIAVLGSDCHNMQTRKPNLGDALAWIEHKEGKEAVRELAAQAERLLKSSPAGIT